MGTKKEQNNSSKHCTLVEETMPVYIFSQKLKEHKKSIDLLIKNKLHVIWFIVLDLRSSAQMGTYYFVCCTHSMGTMPIPNMRRTRK